MLSLRGGTHFPFYPILLASALLFSGILAQKEGDEWTPRLSLESLEKGENLEKGLRQFSCPHASSLCKGTGTCCPNGGDCCIEGGYCAPGSWCYATKCCLPSQVGCANKGCMPKDANCCLTDATYCYSGYHCATWNSGTKGCCQKGSLCLDPSYAYPTTSVNTTRSPLTSPTITSTTLQDISISQSPTQSAIPIPTSSNETTSKNLNDPDIHWEGSWELEISPCDPTLQAKIANESGSPEGTYSMSVSLETSGSIAMSIEASSDAVYTINVGGVERTFTGTPNGGFMSNCDFTFSYEHTLSFGEESWSMIFSITPSGASDKRSLEERQSGDGWWVKINQLNIKSNGSPSNTTSTKPTTASSNRASAILSKSWVTWALVSPFFFSTIYELFR